MLTCDYSSFSEVLRKSSNTKYNPDQNFAQKKGVKFQLERIRGVSKKLSTGFLILDIHSVNSLHSPHVTILNQGYTNLWRQFARPTKFCTMAPNIWGKSVWNQLNVNFLAPRSLWCLQNFWKICITLF